VTFSTLSKSASNLQKVCGYLFTFSCALNVGGFKKFSTYKAYEALSQEFSGHYAVKLFTSL
jgi:hypothetical protein